MTNALWILAQRGADSPTNVWLRENPVVLGLIALPLGVLLALAGVNNLRTGVARNKLGMEFGGATAQFSGYLRILSGAALCVFGLYKIFVG